MSPRHPSGPHQPPPGTYLATATTRPAGADRGAGNLADLEADVLTARLSATLLDLGALADDVADRHDHDTDPAPVALLEAICEAPGANLQYASLARRVRAGTISWQQVWQNPRDHDGGLRLLGDVLGRQVHDLGADS